MTPEEAIDLFNEFKGNNLSVKFGELQNELKGKTKNDLYDLNNVYEASIEIKRISAQVDEVVHATGIIKSLPKILVDNEVIEKVSLASGAGKRGFDLYTSHRIAEFKFSVWQDFNSNGWRRRKVYEDYVKLLLEDTVRIKELYVFKPLLIEKFLKSKRAKWQKVLSKSSDLNLQLSSFLQVKNVDGIFLFDVYTISNIEIKDLDAFL